MLNSSKAQVWIDKNYKENKKQEELKELSVNGTVRNWHYITIPGTKIIITFPSFSTVKLNGELDLSSFSNLESLTWTNTEIDSLTIKNLKNLKVVDCNNNELKKIDLTESTNLEVLRCQIQKKKGSKENDALEEIVGLESLDKLTTINSKPFKPIVSLVKKIDNSNKKINEAKNLLVGADGKSGYKKILEDERKTYERAKIEKDERNKIFDGSELAEYSLKYDEYKEQIELVDAWTISLNG